MQILEFIINGKGEVKIETSGFEGKTCSEVTEKVVLSLGAKIMDEENKPEYWDTNESLYLYGKMIR